MDFHLFITTNAIIIEGVKVLKGVVYQTMPVFVERHSSTKDVEEMKEALGSYIDILQKAINKRKKIAF